MRDRESERDREGLRDTNLSEETECDRKVKLHFLHFRD